LDYPPAFATNNVLYVFTHGIELSAYEFEISVSDPNIIAFGVAELTNPGGSTNAATPPWGWVVSIGLCASSDFLPLVRIYYGYFVATISDVRICLEPSVPSSAIPPAPAYLDCTGNIRSFTPIVNPCPLFYPNGCSILWPSQCPVAAEADTWGSLKARH
jgi:hypothetical protein